MTSSLDVVKAINDVRGDAVVVGTMTPNRYWESVSEKSDLDLPIFGAMGKASSVALGIALAQPERKVFCLDGGGGRKRAFGQPDTQGGGCDDQGAPPAGDRAPGVAAQRDSPA